MRAVSLAIVGASLLTAGSLVAPTASVAGAPASPAPSAASTYSGEPAHTDPPRSVVVLGDSLSQGTGSDGSGAPGGGIGEPRPSAAWATGDHTGLDSYADRLEAVGAGSLRRHNLSANGASVREDLVEQATRVPADAELVLIQMGGNDLCRPTESEITPAATYRAEVRRALEWLAQNRPEILVYVTSIPDIYSLWYVRGAPHVGEQWPLLDLVIDGGDGPRAARTSAENDNKRVARFIWNTLGMVPCATMLADANTPRNAGPTPDPADPAEQRRLRVREVNRNYNRILAEECARWLRCRFDDHAVFDLVANRDTAGVLKADPAEWTFVDADISTQDHFHPSFSGQRKLAETAWNAGFDWADVRPPELSLRYPGERPGGLRDVAHLAAPHEVLLNATDDRGVRGLEYRIAPTVEALPTTEWTTVVGSSATVEVTEGALEFRAVDVNGNVSASTGRTFALDTAAPQVEVVLDAPSPTGDAAHAHLPGSAVLLGAVASVAARCTDADSGVAECSVNGTSTTPYLDTSEVGSFSVVATGSDRVGNTASRTEPIRVVYRWDSTPMASSPGRVEVIRLSLTDATGAPVPDARVGAELIGPDASVHPVPSPLGVIGLDQPRWSAQLGEYVLVLGTASLDPGEWELVLTADDGGRFSHRFRID